LQRPYSREDMEQISWRPNGSKLGKILLQQIHLPVIPF
jgi:hypothetical protein